MVRNIFRHFRGLRRRATVPASATPGGAAAGRRLLRGAAAAALALGGLSLGAGSAAALATYSVEGTADAFCSARDTCSTAHKTTELSPVFTIELAAAHAPLGDGDFSITAWGDFNQADEFLQITLEGMDLGPFLNSDPDDDLLTGDGLFGGRKADEGNEYGVPTVNPANGSVCGGDDCVNQPPRTGYYTIAQSDLASMLADGILEVGLQVTPTVSNGPCCSHVMIEEYVTASLSYDYEASAVVATPAPAAGPLLLSAIVGAGFLRRAVRGGAA